jgi:hypothetical protein
MFTSHHITKLIASERTESLRGQAATPARRLSILRRSPREVKLSLRRRPRVPTTASEER